MDVYVAGGLTKDQAVKFARKAWEADWKKAAEPATTVTVQSQSRGKGHQVTVASFMADSDSECEDEGATEIGVAEDSDEFAQYLALPDVPREVDLLEWWRRESVRFPQLARMARQFLVVPASTAGVERAFSKVSRL